MNSKVLIVTGVAGFIGSNFIHLLKSLKREYTVIGIDKMGHGSNIHNLDGIGDFPRYGIHEFRDLAWSKELAPFSLVEGDICDLKSYYGLEVKSIVNFAAESHVDRSIDGNTSDFVKSNVQGVQNLLQLLVDENKIVDFNKFIQISTDEVYGAHRLNELPHTEDSPLNPTSLYAASKTAGEHIALSYAKTHNIPVFVTRCCNNYGPRQCTEKFIPKVICNTLVNKEVPIYGSGLQMRQWIHVRDHCRAILKVLEDFNPCHPIYNIGGRTSITNKSLALTIINEIGAGSLTYVTDRKSHDFAYKINYGRLKKEFGFEEQESFSDGLKETIEWYGKNTTRI